MIQILTHHDYRHMPWKNGQGFTLEIARSHGEGLDDFDWRVSIADVKTAGAFSCFPNKQRILGVLDGAGLVLNVDKNQPINLRRKTFFPFHGESQVYAELIDGEIRDFNLIYDPQKYSARLQWINNSCFGAWITDADHILIFNNTSELNININTRQFKLNKQETLLVKSEGVLVEFNLGNESICDACVIELFIR